jgi:hypothetical protein
MADVKISALPAVVTAAGTDTFPVVQAGTTKKETLSQALTWIQTQVAPVAAGGTGFGTYTIGDLLVADGAASLAKLADVATGSALISGGVATAPTWGKVGLTTHVSGILPSANGGTGVNNAGTITNASNTTITGGGTIALGGFTLTVPATGTVVLLGSSNTFTAAQALTVEDAVTNTTTTLLTYGHNSSGTPAASFGTRVLYQLESSTTPDQDAAAMDVIWTTATHATRASVISVKAVTAGGALTEGLRISTAGISLIAGITNSALASGTLSLVANGGIALVQNNTNSANSSLRLQAGFALNTGMAVTVAFAGTLTAAFDVLPAAASTAAVVDNLILRRNPSSGTPAAGTGQQLHFVAKTTTTDNRDQFTLSTEWVVATEASQTTRAKLTVYDTAAREAIRIEASGSAAMIGVLGAAAVVRQTGGENLTNSVTSGGTDGTIANYTDLTVYATDAAAIRNNIYQLARALKQDHDALRLYGFLT